MAPKLTIVATLLFLVLALQSPKFLQAKENTGGAAEEGAKAEKVAEAFCDVLCKEKGEPQKNCREFCGLGQRANAVFLEAILCKSKCSEMKDAPAIKSCEDQCGIQYEAGIAEIIKTCHIICGSGEKDLAKIDSCKKSCTSPAITGTPTRG